MTYVLDLGNVSAGWTSIMVVITFFTGVQLVSLWIISEYIGKIYEDVKGRPEYVVDKTINID